MSIYESLALLCMMGMQFCILAIIVKLKDVQIHVVVHTEEKQSTTAESTSAEPKEHEFDEDLEAKRILEAARGMQRLMMDDDEEVSE